MHTLTFLEPGHFHATLTLKAAHLAVVPEVFVYASAGPELDDFLALIERFNRRAERPTDWRPRVRLSADPLAQLLVERPGDVVVLAGKNGGKARVLRRLHAAGLHVLADKPWLVEPADLADIRASLAGGPIAREMMTGRRDTIGRLVKRLVDDAEIFGGFATNAAAEPAIEQESVHHFEKLVDGAPLRRPWWFFDPRVQGSGAVDIPTHLVDQVQWLLDGAGAPGDVPELLAARGWSTRVPVDVFARITGAGAVPPELRGAVEGDALRVFCNAELTYRLRAVTARAATRWEVSSAPGGGDTSRLVLRGRAAAIRVEQSAATRFRRRVIVEARGDAAGAARHLARVLAGGEWRGATARAVGPASHEIDVPPALDGGHEAHFAELLDELLGWIDTGHRPAALAEWTLAKYTLLAEAAAVTARDDAAAR
ncbi:MAG TPA: putative oxidoreductase C-terminal domain-containing protein [Candidatus Deferrimicrobiaceae bacterium]|nr:putative oxidoreductase C-terminal domain-containing protein [Candidatus Deferrimicrobiaceae bacterium]